MFRAKQDKVLNQQLQVQEVVVRKADTQLYATSGSDIILLLGEPLTAAVSVLFQDDSAGTVAPIAAANLSIVDSTAYTAGGDLKAIKVASLTFATSDVLIVRYVSKS